jgi:hypothetical protein
VKKKQTKSERLVVLANPELMRLVRKRAKQEDLSVGELVRCALYRFLDEWPAPGRMASAAGKRA